MQLDLKNLDHLGDSISTEQIEISLERLQTMLGNIR